MALILLSCNSKHSQAGARKMNDIFGEIPPLSRATQTSNLRAENKIIQAGQTDFPNFSNTEKIELSKQAKMFKEAISLIKEVGILEYSKIVRTVQQIQRALTRAMQDFPAHRKEIEAMIDSYEKQMPRSVSEALGRLNRMLKESQLPKEIIDAITRYVEEEMKQSPDTKVYDNRMNLIHI